MLTITQKENLLLDLAGGTETMRVIGARYGVSHERVRQLALQHLSLAGVERQKIRSIENRWELRRGLYPEYVAAVWHEAERRGFEVRGWIDHTVLMMRSLFINKRLVQIMRARNKWTSKNGRRFYARFTVTHSNRAHIFIVDNQCDGERHFYIVPREACTELAQTSAAVCIPLNDCTFGYESRHKARVNFAQYENAWELFDTARACDRCDRIGGTPITIEDRDPASGYGPVEVQACTLCKEGR